MLGTVIHVMRREDESCMKRIMTAEVVRRRGQKKRWGDTIQDMKSLQLKKDDTGDRYKCSRRIRVTSYLGVETSIPLKPMMHISPLSQWSIVSPISTKFIYFPYFCSIYIFGLIFLYFTPAYFDHDVFMQHSLHVLDAPAWEGLTEAWRRWSSIAFDHW